MLENTISTKVHRNIVISIEFHMKSFLRLEIVNFILLFLNKTG